MKYGIRDKKKQTTIFGQTDRQTDIVVHMEVTLPKIQKLCNVQMIGQEALKNKKI